MLWFSPNSAHPTPLQGDMVEILIITKDGIKKDSLQLKLD